MMREYNAADVGLAPGDISNFRRVELNWSEPLEWHKDALNPCAYDGPCLYILQREHGRARERMRIVYVGLTKNPQRRFQNHPKAKEILERRGKTFFSYAPINLTGRNKDARTARALEEIEHLLIWALWPGLENERKMFVAPGMGLNRGSGWQIVNTGHSFLGQMPAEIIYPWLIIKPQQAQRMQNQLSLSEQAFPSSDVPDEHAGSPI